MKKKNTKNKESKIGKVMILITAWLLEKLIRLIVINRTLLAQRLSSNMFGVNVKQYPWNPLLTNRKGEKFLTVFSKNKNFLKFLNIVNIRLKKKKLFEKAIFKQFCGIFADVLSTIAELNWHLFLSRKK